MKPEPRIVDGVPMCNAECPQFSTFNLLSCCAITGDRFVLERPCQPAIRNLVAQVAEVKRLCQAANRPDNPLSAQSLAAGVLRCLGQAGEIIDSWPA